MVRKRKIGRLISIETVVDGRKVSIVFLLYLHPMLNMVFLCV